MMEKPRVTDKDWSNVFPVVSTDFDSVSFLERLISVAITTVLSTRKILPNSEFEDKAFNGMILKVLKKETGNAHSQKIHIWLSGAFDALRKKFLKSISLEIADFRSDTTLEMYTFNISYDVGHNSFLNVSVLCEDQQSIFGDQFAASFQFQTMKLLRMFYRAAKSSLALPNEFALFMKLSYHENTPAHYQPRGYRDHVPKIYIFPKKTKRLGLGATNTGYHFITCVTKTCLLDENEFTKSGNETIMVKGPDRSSRQSSVTVKSKHPCNTGKDSKLSHLVGDCKICDEDSKQNSSQGTDDASQSDFVRCPCLSQVKTYFMYQCSGCSYWECFGINHAKNLVKIEKFYCQLCHKLNKDYMCCDKLMVTLDRACDQQKLAVQRRLLGLCSRMEKQAISFRKFEKASGLSYQQSLIHSILKNLIKDGVLNELPRDTYSVNRNNLTQKMAGYFFIGTSLQGKTSKRNQKVMGNGKLAGDFSPELKKRTINEINGNQNKF